MAFIAPVQRNGREFSLYRPSASKNSAVLVKTSRSNSTPIRIVAKADNLRLQQVESKRSRQYSTCVSTSSSQNSPALMDQRRSSRRISVKKFSSLDSNESNATTDSKRRVRFGHCEEIEFSSDEEDEQIRDRIAVQKVRECESNRPRSASLMDIPEKFSTEQKRPSQFANFLRIARLSYPLN